MSYTLPKISYCVVTYNEERRIKDCLVSIFSQDYPKNLLEVILVDDRSTDRTVEIARRFPVKIVFSGKRHTDFSVMMGLREAKGDFYHGIGADMQFRGKNWFRKNL